MDTSSPEHGSAEPVRTVRLDSVAPQPWRNGGGRTRELLAWPSADAWSLRISVAEIERDGPFSAFPGVQRWFAVIEGAGVALSFGDAERTCRRGDAPLAFDGGAAPDCRLLDGPTRDLNLMAREGRATLRAVRADDAWDAPFAWRGLYAAVAGRWHDGVGSCDVAAGTLLWIDGIGPGRVGAPGVDENSMHSSRAGAEGQDADRMSVDRIDAGSRAARAATAWRFAPGPNGDAQDMTAAWWIGYSPAPRLPR